MGISVMRQATMRVARTIFLLALAPALLASTDGGKTLPFPSTREGLELYLSQLDSVIQSQLNEFEGLLPAASFTLLREDHDRWLEARRNACALSQGPKSDELARLRCLVLKSESYYEEREIRLGEVLDASTRSISP
jgi:hypothetical protein